MRFILYKQNRNKLYTVCSWAFSKSCDLQSVMQLISYLQLGRGTVKYCVPTKGMKLKAINLKKNLMLYHVGSLD